MITEGRYKAKATGNVVLGKSSQKGTPYVELYFKILEGPNQGGEVRWQGYFSEKTATRTVEALQNCGWEGDDIGEFSDGGLHGLDTNEVSVVVELEQYQTNDGETKTAPRVAWVNKLTGYLSIQNAMSQDEASSFGERMKGLVLKAKAKQDKASESFNHGANVQPKAAAGARKF